MARPVVLVAAGDAREVASIARFLDLEGFDCARARSGAEAVEALLTGRVAAVLLDDELQEPDAVAITHRLRAEPATAALPVLLFAQDEAGEAAAFAAGASAVIYKPYHLAAIAARLREMVADVEPPRG